LHTGMITGQAMAAGKKTQGVAPGSGKLSMSLSHVTVSEASRLFAGSHVVNPAALHALLDKLPPAGSSYTMRITDHGKPLAAYVVKDGQLVKVIRYGDQNKQDKEDNKH